MNGLGRSAATVRRVDVSADHREPPAVPASSESTLFFAYRAARQGRIEHRPCVCGGMVSANPAAPAKGVQAHNYTGRHRAWRENRVES